MAKETEASGTPEDTKESNEPKAPPKPADPKEPTPYDGIYKDIFSHPAMVKNLCDRFLAPELVENLDFASLEKVNTNFVSDNIKQFHDDIVWKIRSKSDNSERAWRYLYLPIEFQSSNDITMALRVMIYVGLLYQDLLKQELYEPNQLPPVYPLVVYNGTGPWTAGATIWDMIVKTPDSYGFFSRDRFYHLLDEKKVPTDELGDSNLYEQIIRLEQCQDPEEAVKIYSFLLSKLQGPDNQSLRRALGNFMGLVTWKRLLPDGIIPEINSLEEGLPMLTENVSQWAEQKKQEGRQEGRQETLNILQTLIAKRFGQGTVDDSVKERLRTADSEQLYRWAERILEARTVNELFS